MVNSTVARNLDATGMHLAGGILEVSNSVIFFNNANETQVSGVPSIAFSDIQGGFDGEGNIGFQPAFCGAGCGAGDLQLVLGSPAIDAGDPDSSFNDECVPPSLGTERNDMRAFGAPGACGWIDIVTDCGS